MTGGPFLETHSPLAYIDRDSSARRRGPLPLTATPQHILLVRTDRIGDLVLSLPMLPLLKRRFPSADITILVREYTRELIDGHSCVSAVLLYDKQGVKRGFRALLGELRSRRFDIAVVPYPRFRVALLLALAGIPIRVATGYRWYSFLFNRRVYEHRKDARRHEVEYNLHLLAPLGITSDGRPDFELKADGNARRRVEDMLRSRGIQPGERFAVLHTGSGGSARDWSPENFSRLGDRLAEEQALKIVLTGSREEQPLVERVRSAMRCSSVSFAGEVSLMELAALLASASLVVANSTGPLHIAAVQNVPVIAFYPPIVQCSAVRWGPYTDRKAVFSGDNAACPLCKGGPCRSNVCMDQIAVDDVVHAAKKLLNNVA